MHTFRDFHFNSLFPKRLLFEVGGGHEALDAEIARLKAEKAKEAGDDNPEDLAQATEDAAAKELDKAERSWWVIRDGQFVERTETQIANDRWARRGERHYKRQERQEAREEKREKKQEYKDLVTAFSYQNPEWSKRRVRAIARQVQAERETIRQDIDNASDFEFDFTGDFEQDRERLEEVRLESKLKYNMAFEQFAEEYTAHIDSLPANEQAQLYNDIADSYFSLIHTRFSSGVITTAPEENIFIQDRLANIEKAIDALGRADHFDGVSVDDMNQTLKSILERNGNHSYKSLVYESTEAQQLEKQINATCRRLMAELEAVRDKAAETQSAEELSSTSVLQEAKAEVNKGSASVRKLREIERQSDYWVLNFNEPENFNLAQEALEHYRQASVRLQKLTPDSDSNRPDEEFDDMKNQMAYDIMDGLMALEILANGNKNSPNVQAIFSEMGVILDRLRDQGYYNKPNNPTHSPEETSKMIIDFYLASGSAIGDIADDLPDDFDYQEFKTTIRKKLNLGPDVPLNDWFFDDPKRKSVARQMVRERLTALKKDELDATYDRFKVTPKNKQNFAVLAEEWELNYDAQMDLVEETKGDSFKLNEDEIFEFLNQRQEKA